MLNKKALAATAGGEKIYVEDVFSTYLYTDSSVTPTITNGIDLLNEGGLVWTKCRGTPTTYPHILVDTVRGIGNNLQTNNTNAQSADVNSINAVYSNGYKVNGGNSIGGGGNNYNFVSWTFRKAEKFFDVVTYTGNGASSRSISHNLGSVPGCIIIKCTSAGSTNWIVWHRAFTSGQNLELNTTGGGPYANAYFDPLPTSTVFTLSSVGSGGFVDNTNKSGSTYVAYLFAHDAGGFGDSGSDSVIKCGSWTNDGSNLATIDLGWEPQFLIIKQSDGTGSWNMYDNMRGWTATGLVQKLYSNLSNAEFTSTEIGINPRGFKTLAAFSASTYIYIAIRRGPMKTPTVGTSVFSPIATSAAPDTVLTTGFPVDAAMYALRNTAWTYNSTISNRLTGLPTPGATTTDVPRLQTSSTAAELVLVSAPYKVDNTGFTINPGFGGSIPVIYWNFGRAPGFFDVVCYTGTGANRTVSHNLGVAPELMIVKRRNNATEHWNVYNSASGATKYMRLNQTLAASTASVYWNDTAPTASVFTVGTDGGVNASGGTYVAYLFASLSGVSKIGSYSGNGSSQTINCGFTGGARFILIKRTDTTDTTYGNWYVWDSARGIVAGNDPRLNLNTTGAEVTTDDSVDTDSTGFVVNEVAATKINTSGSTYLYLAIA